MYCIGLESVFACPVSFFSVPMNTTSCFLTNNILKIARINLFGTQWVLFGGFFVEFIILDRTKTTQFLSYENGRLIRIHDLRVLMHTVT